MRFVNIMIFFIFTLISKVYAINIITTVKPLADIVREVAGDRASVNYIIPPSINLHIYEYKTKDIKQIMESDLFIFIGSGEPNISSITKNIPKDRQLKVSSIEGLNLIRETDHPDEIHPGLWLDPENALVIAKNVLDFLVKKDPKNRDYYLENYKNFNKNIDELIKYGKSKLGNLKNKNFVSQHYEFPYFTKRFGLIYLAELELGHGREPTPKHLISVIQKIKSNNVKTIFTSRQFYNKKLVDLIVSKTGVRVVFLDSQGENESYIKMMRYNIDRTFDGLNY